MKSHPAHSEANLPELGSIEECSAHQITRRIRKPRKLPPTEPPLFVSQTIEMTATGAPVISATQAYCKRPEWEEYSPGKLYFQRRFGKGRYVEFYIMNQQEQQPESITTQAEHEVQERYGVMAARLHAIFATYATRQIRPWEESFCLRGSDLIQALGLDRRKDMTKSEKLQAIADLAWLVGTLGAIVHWREGQLDLCVTRKSPVWVIQYVEEYFQPQILGVDSVDELCEVLIRVQPGAWAEKFLNREGEQENRALHQFGYLHKAAFALNPNRQELAAVLTLYLLQNRRARSSGKYRIRTLLEAVLAPQEITSIQQTRQYRSRFVQRFYDALEALVEIGFQIQFDATFPIELRPAWSELPDEDDAIDAVATAPKKASLPIGFFELWLDGILHITAPTDVEAVVAEVEARRSKANSCDRRQKARSSESAPATTSHTIVSEIHSSRSSHSAVLTGHEVRRCRKLLKMSQAELAQHLGKSQSWVRDLENKFSDRSVPEEYLDRLQQLFGRSHS